MKKYNNPYGSHIAVQKNTLKRLKRHKKLFKKHSIDEVLNELLDNFEYGC